MANAGAGSSARTASTTRRSDSSVSNSKPPARGRHLPPAMMWVSVRWTKRNRASLTVVTFLLSTSSSSSRPTIRPLSIKREEAATYAPFEPGSARATFPGGGSEGAVEAPFDDLEEGRRRHRAAPRVEIGADRVAVIERQGVEGRQAFDRDPRYLGGLRVRLAGLPERRDDEVEGDVLASLVRPVGSRIDAEQPDHAPRPARLLQKLAQHAFRQRLVPVQESPRQAPLSPFEEVSRALDQQKGPVLLHDRMDDDVPQGRTSPVFERARDHVPGPEAPGLTGATTTSVGCPLRKFSIFSTARRRPSRITSGVCPAWCGERTTLASPRIGSPGLRGSSWKTSSPAPASRPCASASCSASRSTRAPRPVLTRIAVFFMSDSSRRPRKPRVSGARRRWSETKSAARSNPSLALGVPLRALHVRTSMPKARPSSATRAPILPVPKTASVLPKSWPSISRGQTPPRISRSIRGILRTAASMSASVCSATAKALIPGVLHTVMPRRPAASRSTLSVPVPQIETSRSARHAAKTWSVKRAWARMLMTHWAPSMRLISSASSSAPRWV